jgi:hypothetical protein
VLREVGPVAEVAPATHHGQVDAGAAAGHLHRQDVDVAVDGREAALVHRLLVQHTRQRADAVAQLGRLLELQRFRVRHHLRLQVLDHLLLFALQEAFGVAHVACIVGGVMKPTQGPEQRLDLVQQAGPRTVLEDRVLAGAQQEDLLQQLDGLLHRPGAGIGPEVAVPAVHRAAEVGHARVALRLRGTVVGGTPVIFR